MKRKILSLIICVIMLIPANIIGVKAEAISANEMYQKFQELKKKYPEGSTWTGSYNNLSWQCMGWAETVCDYLFNENPRNWDKKTNWDKVCVGDHVRINNDGHSIVITNIIGDTIYYADCNAGMTNQVHWDKTMSRATLASVGTWRKTQASNGIRSDITPSAPAPVPSKSTIQASAEYAKESTSITVSWSKDSKAVKYEYFIAEYPKAYAYTTNSGHGFTTDNFVKFDNLISGNYSVFIHGISADGERSEQSNWVTFDIFADDYIPKKVVIYNNHIYALYENVTTWTFANDLCVALGGHLATVTSPAENAVVTDLVQSGSDDTYWLGASAPENSDKDYQWVTGESFSYSNWMSGQPSAGGEKGTKQRFLEIVKSYDCQWNDVKNTNKKGFILEIDIDEYSPVATQTYNGNKYLLFDKNTTWTEADAFCKALGGHLLYTNNEEEQEFIKTFIKNGQRDWYYIGGQKKNGVWKWENGSKADFINWSANADSWTGTNLMMYKSGTCVGLRNAYYPVSNLNRMGFVCEIENSMPTETLPPSPTATAKPTFTPTPTLKCFTISGSDITNTSDTEQRATIIIAKYDGNELRNVTSTKETFSAGQTKTFTIPQGGKIFVWDSLEEMKPLAEQ